ASARAAALHRPGRMPEGLFSTGAGRGAPTTPRRRRAEMTGPAPGWTSGGSRPDPDLGFDAVLAADQLGVDSAVAVLYRRFNPALVRYLGAGAAAVAEDLAAEVWLA